jgi:hypothetical protein
MTLTDTALKALRPQDKPWTLAGEKGLYVRCSRRAESRG